jgi:hypothetical protein
MTLGGQEVTRLRAELVSDGRHGGPSRAWAHASSTAITGVSVQPFATAESTIDAAYIADRLRLFAPPGTDIVSTDRIVYDGVTYEVDGNAQPWHDLGGQAHHIELVIKRLAG